LASLVRAEPENVPARVFADSVQAIPVEAEVRGDVDLALENDELGAWATWSRSLSLGQGDAEAGIEPVGLLGRRSVRSC